MKSIIAIALLGAAAQAETYIGCSVSAVSSHNTTNDFMSIGLCAATCRKEPCAVAFAISGDLCHCGQLPAQSDLVEDARCDTPCPGFMDDKCGGDGLFSVYLVDK